MARPLSRAKWCSSAIKYVKMSAKLFSNRMRVITSRKLNNYLLKSPLKRRVKSLYGVWIYDKLKLTIQQR